ncbi:hypothetical protein VKT23_013574 [Stygiomarasmius scandens]|uniref:Uncharacterized protein n=1 Tax=Marasmiellus scandens TaxID=2682957 RepID=A0ABR1J7L9_9AGAR
MSHNKQEQITPSVMLATRAASSLARQRAIVPAIQHRNASTASHDDHHDHHHHEDTTVYPQERFLSPFWGKMLLVTALAGAAIKYAPERGDDAFFTRWIQMYTTSPDKWMEMNAQHAAQSKEVAERTILFATASRPAVHRFRFPQNMAGGSPFNNPVGADVDMSDVAQKKY